MNAFGAEDLLNEQQRELNHIGCINRKMCGDDLLNALPDDHYNPMTSSISDDKFSAKKYEGYVGKEKQFSNYRISLTPYKKGKNTNEENLTMWFKVKRYYKQFGFKRSVKRVFEKLSGK
ncbi:MAG: hypothetical protein NC401_14940 [Ruminococcus sp.]|nr:hypothetical protein [Ruminococcus sp.]